MCALKSYCYYYNSPLSKTTKEGKKEEERNKLGGGSVKGQ